MEGNIHSLHSDHTPLWRGAQLKHRDIFTFYFIKFKIVRWRSTKTHFYLHFSLWTMWNLVWWYIRIIFTVFCETYVRVL